MVAERECTGVEENKITTDFVLVFVILGDRLQSLLKKKKECVSHVKDLYHLEKKTAGTCMSCNTFLLSRNLVCF